MGSATVGFLFAAVANLFYGEAGDKLGSFSFVRQPNHYIYLAVRDLWWSDVCQQLELQTEE